MLSSNQAAILTRLSELGRPVAIEAIAEWQLNGHPFGENAARNALKRMEDRNLVTGSGVGKARAYLVTRVGISTLAEAPAPPPAARPEPTSDSRPYHVLERVALEDLDAWLEANNRADEHVDLFIEVAVTDARNAEHALRQAAREAYADSDADPVLVPVADRMWQPTPVSIRNRRTISIGQ